LVLAALYCLLIRRSPLGNDCLIVASDEAQARDDLEIARRLVECNPALGVEIEVLAKELRLRDGSGSLKIIPGRDIAGAHGKTYVFLGVDEIHTARSWDLLEALAPDPTRLDSLRWITSYDTIYNQAGVPLFDLKQVGKSGADPRMLFSWYSGGDLNTDAAFADLEPELRANPSFGSWADGVGYLEQQKRTLPTHRYRRLHLNLPGAPEGAVFDQGKVMACVVRGRKALPYVEGVTYYATCDMSGGSADDAVLAIGHAADDGRVVVDRVEQQAGSPPFNPRTAVHKFFGLMREYWISRVTGDRYAGLTFRSDFESYGATYFVCQRTTSELYEALEPVINAGLVELPDDPKLLEQILTLVHRGGKIDHEPGAHDDYANAVAGLVHLIRPNVFVERIPFVAAYAASKTSGVISDGGVYWPTGEPEPAAAAAAPRAETDQEHLARVNDPNRVPIPQHWLKSGQQSEPWSAWLASPGWAAGMEQQSIWDPRWSPPRNW
jgi:hypothetical protein